MMDKLLLDHLVFMEILENNMEEVQKTVEFTFLGTSNYKLTTFGNQVIKQVEQNMQTSIPEVFYRWFK
jgi:hypothetical protein